jgi:hypothetical protein
MGFGTRLRGRDGTPGLGARRAEPGAGGKPSRTTVRSWERLRIDDFAWPGGSKQEAEPNRCVVAKGPRKNKFAELAPRFGPDLVDPIEQNRSNGSTISRILRLRIGRRWPEDGMPKWEIMYARSLTRLIHKRPR